MNGPWFEAIVTDLEFPVSKSNQRALRRAIVNSDGSWYNDITRKGYNDAEKVGEDDTNAEDPVIRIVLLKSLMSRKRNLMEMVCGFYKNYCCTLEKKASSKTEIKKEIVLDSVRVRAIPVDISERTTTRVLMGGDFTVLTRITEYGYRMEAMKGIRKLSTEDKMLHFQWMANIIAEEKEGAEWVTSRKPIYKASLNFLSMSWWSIVRHCLTPIVNDNALSGERAALVACIMYEYLLNIPRIIAIEIRERVVKENTTLPFSSLIYQLCMDFGVPFFPDIDHMITNIRTTNITLIKDG
ncbi:hypothetical protein HAX54_001810 [Datura stramonium]|uniref:Putative plant transposon protein domain-containing protein n=1 Tax=Datura stramonium TaxID=4076 RepID=A0ABS8T563_DATST|nr:hypothetical protein [Datura stramonium]